VTATSRDEKPYRGFARMHADLGWKIQTQTRKAYLLKDHGRLQCDLKMPVPVRQWNNKERACSVRILTADLRGCTRIRQERYTELCRKKPNLNTQSLPKKSLAFTMTFYNEIGHGFLESVYSNCMNIALTQAGFQVQREVLIPVLFRSQNVGKFKADLLVDNLILLELKADRTLDRSHDAQLLNYLRATALEVGLLLNFGAAKPQFRRLVFENENKKIRVHSRESAVGIDL
jgi:GxxExxY protein